MKLFDSVRIARYHARAHRGFARHDFLHRRTCEEIQDRLQSITRPFERGIIVDPHASAYPGWPGTLAPHAGWPDMDLPDLDLIISLLHLHVENDLPGALGRFKKALRPDGLFLGALYGERTLHELRHVLLQAESECTGGAQARIAPFAQIRDLGGLMQRAGFALPVVDVERIKVHYASLQALMYDLRGMGQGNPLAGPVRPLRRDVLARAGALYQQQFADPDGRLVASFEIVHLCGWAPHKSQQQPLKPGSAQISLTEVLGKKQAENDD
jgi:SAM-dependent methyltransferase